MNFDKCTNLIQSQRISPTHLMIQFIAQRLDASTSHQFKTECQELWSPEIQELTINMTNLEFIDSSGIGALLNLYKKLPINHQTMKLIHVSEPVENIIKLLRLHRVFEIQN
jgi:anti-anti-sigma factor